MIGFYRCVKRNKAFLVYTISKTTFQFFLEPYDLFASFCMSGMDPTTNDSLVGIYCSPKGEIWSLKCIATIFHRFGICYLMPNSGERKSKAKS